MTKDPIIDEIRRHRKEIAEKFDYDLRAIIADAHKRQKTGRKKVVSRARTKKKRTVCSAALAKPGLSCNTEGVSPLYLLLSEDSILSWPSK